MCSEISSFISPRLLRCGTNSVSKISFRCKLTSNYSNPTATVRSICTPPRVQSTWKWRSSPRCLIEDNPKDEAGSPDGRHRGSDEDILSCRDGGDQGLHCPGRSRLPSVDTPLRKPWLDDGVPASAVTSVVGKGGFGTVVKALYKGQEVAVKVVRKHRRASLKSLDNEENALSLNHPNLVSICRVVNEDRHDFGLVLMEICPNLTLQQIIDDPSFTICPEIRLRYLIDISEALSYCHRQGIIHLDVKPRNVLVLLKSNRSKLCDFGMSRKIDSKFDSNSEYFGTVAYSAPELFCHRRPTIKCDVYSYGILMWQLQTRETPYHGLVQDAIIYKVVSQDLRPPPRNTTQFDLEYSSIYQNCWCAHPSKRPTINYILSKLNEIFQQFE
nr:PREDICTED: serine/threonine-protein kinase mos [Bemisia tabaci]